MEKRHTVEKIQVYDRKEDMKKERRFFSFRHPPVVFVLLSGSQQLLDVLGDLLGLADDILRAGERGVRLRFRGVQLWNGATFSQPTAAPHPPSPAQSVVEGGEGGNNHGKLLTCDCPKSVSGWCSYPESSISESLNVLS